MKLRRWSLVLALVSGCSEARDVVVVADDASAAVDTPAATDMGSAVDLGALGDVGGPRDVGTPVDAGVPVDVPSSVDARAESPVVINEIRAADDDWIELKNISALSVALGNLVIADSDADSGAPRIGDGATFPAGTTLAPGQHLLIVADRAEAGVGVQMRCLSDAGPMTCYHAGFGISASRGERIYLMSASGTIATSAEYPANAAAEGQSWGRLPDGTGPFAANRPTPGATNAAP